MQYSPRKFSWCIYVLFSALFITCSKKENSSMLTGALEMYVHHSVGDRELIRNGSVYTNTYGEAYTISALKYYISNITLLHEGPLQERDPEYFLVDDSVTTSRLVRINGLNEGIYYGIRFTLGVDSIRNVSGVQTGALAPENGMFWSWNSGYIMAKLEGKSGGKPFRLHIGGYRQPYNAIRTVTLNFPKPLWVSRDATARIILQANVAAWMGQPNPVKLSDAPDVMVPGAAAVKIADNYQKMFSVTEMIGQP